MKTLKVVFYNILNICIAIKDLIKAEEYLSQAISLIGENDEEIIKIKTTLHKLRAMGASNE